MSLSKPRSTALIRTCGGCALLAFLVCALISIWWFAPYFNAREYLRDVEANGDVVMDAIDRFVAKNGHPPERLDLLIPDYVGAIPESGFPRCREFTYYVWENEGNYRWRLSVFCEFLHAIALDADEIECWSDDRHWRYRDN